VEKNVRIGLFAIVVCAAMPAAGEDRSLDVQASGVTSKGSGNTIAGRQPAARSGDATSDPGVTLEGASPHVLSNGHPVAVGDTTRCRGLAVGGQSNVLINGKSVARAGDLTSLCPSNSCGG